MALLCWKCIPPRGTPYAIQADASDEIIWATGPEEKAKDNGEKTDNQANGAAEVWEKQDHPPPLLNGVNMQEEMIMSREHQLGVLFTCILQFRGLRQARLFLFLMFSYLFRLPLPCALVLRLLKYTPYSVQSVLSVSQYQDNKASTYLYTVPYIYTYCYISPC